MDSCFSALGLSLDDDDDRLAPPHAPAAATAKSGDSGGQPPPSPPRPSPASAELDQGQIGRSWCQRMRETGEEAVERRNDMMQNLNGRVSSTETTGEQHPSDVAAFSPRPDGADGDGDGVFLGPSPGGDNQSSSLDSSMASSPSWSGRHDSELGRRIRLPQSEIEEIPSARFLSPSFLPRPASSAADSWGHLVGRDTAPANVRLVCPISITQLTGTGRSI